MKINLIRHKSQSNFWKIKFDLESGLIRPSEKYGRLCDSGYWLLDIGSWLLASGCQLLVAYQLPIAGLFERRVGVKPALHKNA